MNTKIKIILLFLLGLIACCIIFVFDRQLRAKAENRASMFISINWLIQNKIHENLEAPESIDEIVGKHFSSAYSETFPSGLFYKKINERSYIIKQREPSFIGLFRRGILIADEDTAPRYLNGKYVAKY